MTDLTMLHAPSTLYLPEVNETGSRFTFNRRSLPPPPLVNTTPMVTVEMVDEDSQPSSPVMAKDNNLLSPPRRTFRSKEPPRISPPRPRSAPPGPTARETGIIDSHDYFSQPPKTAHPFSSGPCTTPVVVRPPTILCGSIVPLKSKDFLTSPLFSPPKAILEEYSTFGCNWDILRLFPSSYPPLDVHSCRTSF